MAYSTYSDIAAASGRILNTTSKPTATQVADFITQIDAEIDCILRTKGYSLPITDTTALSFLKRISVVGGCMMMERAMFAGAAPNESNRFADYKNEYNDMLNKLDGSILTYSGSIDISQYTDDYTDEPFVKREDMSDIINESEVQN